MSAENRRGQGYISQVGLRHDTPEHYSYATFDGRGLADVTHTAVGLSWNLELAENDVPSRQGVMAAATALTRRARSAARTRRASRNICVAPSPNSRYCAANASLNALNE